VIPALPIVSARVETEPSDGATDVSPIAPVRVTVSDGTIDTVALTNPQGKQVAGKLASDAKSWTATEPLGYDKTYTWSGTATGVDGQARPIAGSFHTLKPQRLVAGRLNVADGSTYGVAMPIGLTFDSPVTDKAAVERALSVRTSVPTEGSWAWLDDTRVHWRPKAYFAPGTQVNVTAKLYGLATGDGGYGSGDVASHFTVGRSYVLRGDTRTHRLTAFVNGAQVADYPASYGLDSDPGRVTHSGTHVVMQKFSTYFMSNPKYDYQNVEARWAVRISNNGEFLHSAPWSVRQQGNSNVSHGCVNLAPGNAEAVFDAVLPGDPVEIVGSSQQLGSRDGDYYDWAIPWEEWTSKSALPTS
jgi:lipoprotein-anchoring transpeptidase ErfK/SrfK